MTRLIALTVATLSLLGMVAISAAGCGKKAAPADETPSGPTPKADAKMISPDE